MSRLRTQAPALSVAAFLLGSQLGPQACAKGDGAIDGELTVESQVRGEWRLFAFEEGDVLRDSAGEPVVTADPSGHEGWDLAISQWVLASNSGSSASADSLSRGALLAVEGQVDAWPALESFSALCSELESAESSANEEVLGCNRGTPTVDAGYVPDFEDDPDGAGPFPELSYNPSLSFWFEYDFTGHEVFPYGNIYVVETHDGRCVKLQVTDYYDTEGESGFVSFSWDFLAD